MPDNEQSFAARAFSENDRPEWERRLARNDRGVLLPVLDNVVAILLNDARWAGVIAFDEFAGVVMKRKPPPFHGGELGEWMDIDDARLDLWLAQSYQVRRVSTDAIVRAVLLVADANRYHDVRDYLARTEWDRVPRLDYLLGAYMGAGKSEYTEKVAAKWMIGAVARVMRPGCKMDNVLILEGEQGAMKSSSLEALFSPWFTDAAFEIGSTDGYQIMRGMWCVELAELDGFNRAEASRSKAFFTRRNDRYRSPYGRKPLNVLRQGVFAGSVNHATYLKDDTGNRRYWPVRVGTILLDDIRADRDQLWAEALHRFKAGEEHWVRASERELYETEQDQRYIGDAWETRVRTWLDSVDASPEGRVQMASLADVMRSALSLNTDRWTLAEQQRVGKIMTRIGWKRVRQSSGAREWVYKRPEAGEVV